MTSFPDDVNAPVGGVEAVSVTLVNALSQFDDLDLEVVTTRPAYSCGSTERQGRVTVHRLAWAGGSTLRHAVGAGRRQIQEYLRRLAPEVIHAHDTYGLMVKGMSIPRVFTIHGFIHGDTLLSGRRFAGLRSRVWRRVEAAGWADQPHIISISPYVRERLRGVAAGVIHDIDNPVAERFFQIDRHERGATIFSAAVVTPRKNPLALIAAVGRLVEEGVDVALRLAGSLSDDTYVRCVRERIRSIGMENRVCLLGPLNVDEICKELSAASVFALTSLEENSPIGIEEAMAARVPVVASNRCGMPYMVRDGESGFLVDPHDIEDVTRCLRRLVTDSGLRRSMGAKGREIALDRFHPMSVAARTRQVYLHATGDRRRP